MTLYRKKPVVIEAMQLPAPDGIDDGLPGDFIEFLNSGNAEGWNENRDGTVAIHTLEGTMTADIGDWIIRGVKGELYPCKPDIFEATYERSETQQ